MKLNELTGTYLNLFDWAILTLSSGPKNVSDREYRSLPKISYSTEKKNLMAKRQNNKLKIENLIV